MTLPIIIVGLVISCEVPEYQYLIQLPLSSLSVDYPYINDLLELDSRRQIKVRTGPPIPTCCRTPLECRERDQSLREHPDKHFVSYVVRGIREGFRIRFDYLSHCCKSVKRNVISATDHADADVIRDYLAKECAAGRVLGPFDPQSLPHVQISPFGVIEKKDPGKWRLILDLSSPEGFSVNEGITPNLCSLSYISIHDIANIIVKLGPRTRLAKVDIKSAYRMVPIHPEDCHLLGMKWEKMVYVNAALPFGLRSHSCCQCNTMDCQER